ncbi:methyltransferase domain-containing protein [Brucella intermedia]|uniref:methyltransferase domain-containing protein n=1 Tax=Brucella intermedia TaxID=94625 RepID=UPI00235E2358|nr:methyltransferase domain-containing protein [Brucella intermedia]
MLNSTERLRTFFHSNPNEIPDRLLKDIHRRMKPIITDNIDLLQPFSRKQREFFALKTGTMVLYIGDEVAEVVKAEEEAALRAAPEGYGLEQLVGLNIGCGARLISPYILPVDIMRTNHYGTGAGEHAALTATALLSLSDDLPFKHNTIDYIVALHMLEHVNNPIETVNHWLDIIKPGGGIGIVVPNWRYTWDSRKDKGTFSHKWNPTPDFLRKLYEENWKCKCELEYMETYDFKLSFDVVLRKRGDFQPFQLPDPKNMKSGKELHESGQFMGAF